MIDDDLQRALKARETAAAAEATAEKALADENQKRLSRLERTRNVIADEAIVALVNRLLPQGFVADKADFTRSEPEGTFESRTKIVLPRIKGRPVEAREVSVRVEDGRPDEIRLVCSVNNKRDIVAEFFRDLDEQSTRQATEEKLRKKVTETLMELVVKSL